MRTIKIKIFIKDDTQSMIITSEHIKGLGEEIKDMIWDEHDDGTIEDVFYNLGYENHPSQKS